MTTYECSECGAEAKVIDGVVVRTCEHTAPIIANLEAVVYGESAVD